MTADEAVQVLLRILEDQTLEPELRLRAARVILASVD